VPSLPSSSKLLKHYKGRAMQTATALKRTEKFVDHPAPSPPRVQILLHYTKPAKIDLGWESRPNTLSDVVARNWRPRPAPHEAAIAKANASLLAGLQHLMAEEKRIKEMASEQSAAAARRAEIDGNRYVDVADVAQSTSRVVFLVCLFSLAMWLITGFVMIQPFLAIITMIGCSGFYIMGKMAKKSLAI
jgi:hypothetical protein